MTIYALPSPLHPFHSSHPQRYERWMIKCYSIAFLQHDTLLPLLPLPHSSIVIDFKLYDSTCDIQHSSISLSSQLLSSSSAMLTPLRWLPSASSLLLLLFLSLSPVHSFTCSNIPSPPFNGSMQTITPQQVYSFTCNVGYLLSGPSKIHCIGENQFDSVPPSCITIAANGGCQPRLTSNSHTAMCRANEMVVGGVVDCGSQSEVLGTKPLPNMQGWWGNCAGGSYTVPITITATCCQYAVDTFTLPPAGQLSNIQNLPILPANSFLQNCECFAGDSTTTWNNGLWSEYGIQCPYGKSAIAGGVIHNDAVTLSLQYQGIAFQQVNGINSLVHVNP